MRGTKERLSETQNARQGEGFALGYWLICICLVWGALRTSMCPCPVDSHADLEVGEEIWVAAEKIWTSENIGGDGSCEGE